MVARKKKPAPKINTARIFAYLAKDAPVAVILRRGPTKQVCLIKWDLRTDKLEIGQWFKGRIYERRCDLSADGELFIYFAAKYKEPLYSWTAICRPPYLTAISLWPKGDGWGGGGMFKSKTKVLLNHRPNETAMLPGTSLPEKMTVELFGSHPGWGEDSPIYDGILERNGWKLLEEGNAVFHQDDMLLKFKTPTVLGKTSGRGKFQLRMLFRAIGNPNDSWYWMDYDVLADGELVLDLPRTDWADWDANGNLLFAREGKIFRIWNRHIGKAAEDAKLIEEIADLNGLKFEAKPPIESTLAKKRREQKKK